MEEKIAIRTEKINKYFGKYHALKDVSISVEQGDIYGFIGKNGAGKTTFMRILCGLMKQSSGHLSIGCFDQADWMNRSKVRVGFLPQNIRIKDNVTVNETINFFCRLRNVSCNESFIAAKSMEIDTQHKIKELSPGNQKKVQLLIAIIGKPGILVLDEPTAGLDPVAVQQVRDIIKNLNQKGSTIFVSSHVLAELDNLCNHVAVIQGGKILYQGECTNSYEIEIEGKKENIYDLVRDMDEIKYDEQKYKIYANIKRQQVPQLLKKINDRNINVFAVKPQGLEMLYNNYIGGNIDE